jgi:predicted secreted hydrolase
VGKKSSSNFKLIFVTLCNTIGTLQGLHAGMILALLPSGLMQLPTLSRRQLLAAGLTTAWWPGQARAAQRLRFPRDLGSHPEFSIEWWYLTGHLQALASERQFGFQLTFFRSRVSATQGMRSNFAAKQLLFAHAAVTDVAGKKLLHDQRIAREGFGVAQASQSDTVISLRDWSLLRDATQYRAAAQGSNFRFNLSIKESQPLLLQGDHGWSRKGPDAKQVSYYYSLPQLKVTGTLALQGQAMKVEGGAWLDHEWSQALLPAQAVGWDWIGMNLFDGSALTAFQMRDQAGNALWHGGSFRGLDSAASPQVFDQGELRFEPVRIWISPLTQARYPVEWIVHIKRSNTSPGQSGTLADFYRIKAVIDPQELDSRASTGAVYWEGLSELFDPQGKLLGRGYLEMTGYAAALRPMGWTPPPL